MNTLTNSELEHNILQKWSAIQCNRLKRWFEIAKARKKAHNCAASWNNIWNRLLTYSSFLISAILSTMSLNITYAPAWLLPALSITITIIIVINGFFNFAKQSESHSKTATGFANIIRKIEIAFLQKDNPKSKFSDFIDETGESFNHLLKDVSSLPLYAKNLLSDINLEAPDPFDDFEEN
jgi:hypothetical protein